MSSLRGDLVVDWFERWGARFLKVPQPEIYRMLLLHVGGSGMLREYSGEERYWQHVQTVLDCFFSASERAVMCRDLISEPLFQDDKGFRPFLYQAKAEIRCHEMIDLIEQAKGVRRSLRSAR